MGLKSLFTAAALSAALGLAAGPAAADIVLDWSGTCTSGCADDAQGVLTLKNTYTFGTVISQPVFVSFSTTHPET